MRFGSSRSRPFALLLALALLAGCGGRSGLWVDIADAPPTPEPPPRICALGPSGIVVSHCEKSPGCKQRFVARLAP